MNTLNTDFSSYHFLLKLAHFLPYVWIMIYIHVCCYRFTLRPTQIENRYTNVKEVPHASCPP